jgi:uncharacterized membrane protein YfcA
VTLLILLALALVGLVVGFVSGLIGIGGGVLIVPFLYFFYAHPAWSGVRMPVQLHTVVAHATSLFVIVPTAISGVRSYSKAGLVVWPAAIPIAITSVVGAIAGARLALHLPGAAVRMSFGAFLLVIGKQLLWRPPPEEGRALRIRLPFVIIIGLAVGLLSGLMGIGGGAVAAPLLIYLIRLDLKQAAATSLAIAGLAAIAAAMTYVISGWRAADMPAGSIGYVHLLAALPILAGSLMSVHAGTVVNQRLHSRTLKYIFAAFFIALGVYLIWQNLPDLF